MRLKVSGLYLIIALVGKKRGLRGLQRLNRERKLYMHLCLFMALLIILVLVSKN